MSFGNEDLLQIMQPEELNPTSSRHSKISYTRKFLSSLSDLEICKRLPKGIDESLISELGSSSLQGYSSSPAPLGKVEIGNPSRILDRWDNRASWRSDTDSQSDRDSAMDSTGRKQTPQDYVSPSSSSSLVPVHNQFQTLSAFPPLTHSQAHLAPKTPIKIQNNPQEQLQQWEEFKAFQKLMAQWEEFKAFQKFIAQREEFKAFQKSIAQREEFKAFQKLIAQSEEFKAFQKFIAQWEELKAFQKFRTPPPSPVDDPEQFAHDPYTM